MAGNVNPVFECRSLGLGRSTRGSAAAFAICRDRRMCRPEEGDPPLTVPRLPTGAALGWRPAPVVHTDPQWKCTWTEYLV